ncbi:MAG: ankyrin repeat domain-containing protein [Acidobacteriota bacterium]
MATSDTHPVLSTLLGLNRASRFLYGALFVLAVPAFLAWTVFLPRWKFSDQDEQLFRAARHGDRAGVEQALTAGAQVNAAAPVDGKTALFRAAILGHADVVRVLLEHGADATARGHDGHTALEVATAARADEADPSTAHALDDVVTALREAAPPR